jgi:hypothetical protein
MAGYEDGGTPASQQVSAARDAYVAGRDVHVHFHIQANFFGGRTQPDDGRAVMAEWALWGKDSDWSDYHVLRCSEGSFGPDDFAEVITRYASGAKEALPQYTIFWIPARNGQEAYLAVGIHELADEDPGRSDGRARTAGGRLIEYMRVFCILYSEMADHQVSYSELVEAVQERQLSEGDRRPMRVELPGTVSPPSARPARGLAEDVAALLLDNVPVCILGGRELPAEYRLLFIDQVASLLPYGLRATFSASTWASVTIADLKLRLYFTDARRDDGGRTRYVSWGQHGELNPSRQEPLLSRHYRDWLEDVGPAAEALAAMTAPLRFGRVETREMISRLPKRRSAEDLLREIAPASNRGDGPRVNEAVLWLKSELDRTATPGDQQRYRQVIKGLGLLHDHPGLDPGSQASLYRVLLHLAFEVPLSYASYCEIEDSVGGPLPEMLRRVILELGFSETLPFFVAAKPEAALTDEDVMAALNQEGILATAPLTEFQQHAASARPWHRATGYDLAVQYLRKFAEDPRTELAQRRYLADTLEAAFPGSLPEQQTRLKDTLRFIYGDQLSQEQVSELYARQGALATTALRAAIDSLASSPMPDHFWARWTSWVRALIDRALKFAFGSRPQ